MNFLISPMQLLLLSFVAGILTVLAPCVLPVLPVIIGGSMASVGSKWKPLVIVTSLAVSILLFTLLLKATVLFIGVPFEALTAISGGIIVLVGLVLLFPKVWDAINLKLGFYKSEGMLQQAKGKGGLWGDILLGAALGPVFSSCSPTYAIIVATVLPVNFTEGLLNLIVYSIGLALPLLLIAYLGRAAVTKVRWLADPNGWFKRLMGLLLILVGIFVLTGLDKKLQTYLIDNGLLGTTAIEQQLVDMALPQQQQTSTPTTGSGITFPYNYPAPELQGLDNWLNSKPLTMQELRGKVVLVDFWTFSCINCIRTLPYMRDLQAKYADKGLVILGIHAPEFAFERVPENVAKSVKEYDLKYPIALDNNFATWRAFENRYWPAKYLIDKEGKVRYTHFGEGEYEETEKAIQALLGVTDMPTTSKGIDPGFEKIRTPEIYIGAARRENFGGNRVPAELPQNTFYLTGDWQVDDESATLQSDEGSIVIRYTAPKANIVLEGMDTPAEVFLDGKSLTTSQLGADTRLQDGKSVSTINEARLYNFSATNEENPTHTLEVKFSKSGVKAFAFTFG